MSNARRIILAALVVIALSLLALSLADAAPAEKVLVCKYIGTPGVDERLQTGNNPISVSSNAIPNYNGVGSYFADGQNRSYVLAIDNGQDEPDVSQCPAPQNPDPEEPVDPTDPIDPTPTPPTPTTPVTETPTLSPEETLRLYVK